jgi:hypothetical protein
LAKLLGLIDAVEIDGHPAQTDGGADRLEVEHWQEAFFLTQNTRDGACVLAQSRHGARVFPRHAVDSLDLFHAEGRMNVVEFEQQQVLGTVGGSQNRPC